MTHSFRFDTTKLHQLFAELDDEDQAKFYFNHRTINHEDYFNNSIREIRRLLLKEDESTMPKAQEKLKKIFYADLAVKLVAFLMMARYSLILGEWLSARF